MPISDKVKCLATFTIDVEDGVSIAMRDAFGKQVPQTERVVTSTNEILDMLGNYEVKATFFVLGKVAEVFPELVKRIDKEGHEIGIHGYDHFKFYEMNYEKAKDQLKRAKNVVENLIGAKVLGHRAPAFSINETTKWALELLAELDFKYDSSIMPCMATHYGWPNFTKDICRINLKNNQSIFEIPMSTITFGKMEIPALGGSYLRLFPYWFTKYAFRQVQGKRPAIVYMHPYELDTTRYPDYYFEELKKASFLKNLKMRSNWFRRSSVKRKLNNLLDQYSFIPMNNLLQQNIEQNEISEVELNKN